MAWVEERALVQEMAWVWQNSASSDEVRNQNLASGQQFGW